MVVKEDTVYGDYFLINEFKGGFSNVIHNNVYLEKSGKQHPLGLLETGIIGNYNDPVDGLVESEVDWHHYYQAISPGFGLVHYSQGHYDQTIFKLECYVKAISEGGNCDSLANQAIILNNNLPAQVKTISIFPNPAKDNLMITSLDPAKFEIASIEGRTLLSGNIIKGDNELIIESLVPGVYIIKINR